MARNSVRLIVSSALGINPDELSESSKIYDFPEWDSLGHLKLIQALENVFKVSIDDEETFSKLTHYDEIVSFVVSHLGK